MDTTKTPAPNAVDLEKADTEATAAATDLDQDPEADLDADAELEAEALAAEQGENEQPSHVGSAASAIVAAGLSVVALSGSWVAGIVSERTSITGRLELTQAADANAQIAAQFVGPWHSTALVNGIFSTVALIIAVFVLALPAFGTPERHLPTWVRSVSWASIALGVLGVLLFVLMYFDLLLAVPKAAGVAG
ncbi:hypothetical protein ACFWBN_20870 [Streptomyces sp. NPDC059989]|uniref:hypothetical protein n=1 Tax=Streptomyces sp. NPDC059989 TaxID=3347026 RepID=UPI0036A2A553